MDTYMLKKIYDIFSIPVYVVRENEDVFSIPALETHQSPFGQDAMLREALVRFAQIQKKPFLYLETEMIYYGIFQDEENNTFLFGPMARKTIKNADAEAYRHYHHISMKTDIPKCGMGIASKMLALAYYHDTGKEIENQDISVENRSGIVSQWNQEDHMEQYQLAQSEEERTYNSMEYENKVLQIVRSGDVAAMKELMSTDLLDMDNVGVVAMDSTKQTEYLMVTFIALITRAAIDGGLNPEQAYEIGDMYLQQIEKCRTAAEIAMVGAKAQIDVTARVQEAKKHRSRLVYIEKCKDYIARHLRKPFQVGDIAPAIGVNRTYLAKKFSETEGMTIQQYIMKERCRHAANLLKYSTYPISIISEYFCFSSQSHFGVQFKKIYGMTPNEHRIRHGYIESYNNENK